MRNREELFGVLQMIINAAGMNDDRTMAESLRNLAQEFELLAIAKGD